MGEIIVDFDAAEGDIDLSQMIFDTDVNKKKSILYMPSWPKEIEKEKILFIPK